MKFVEWAVICSGCLYAWLIKLEYGVSLDQQWVSLLFLQSLFSSALCFFCTPFTSQATLTKPRILTLGFLYTVSNVLPIWLAISKLLDYGHVTLVRICSVIIPAIYNYKTANWWSIMYMLVSLVLSKFAVYSEVWPFAIYGILLAILSGVCASLMGIIQTSWNPYSKDALRMNLVQLVLICMLYVYKQQFIMPNMYLLLCGCLQTWAINAFFQSGSNSMRLGILLAFRKIIFVFISTNWASVKWPLYLISIFWAWKSTQ